MENTTASPDGRTQHRFKFHGNGTDLLLLILKNLFLTVITLGIYAAWARAQRRQFLWSNTEISGQRLVFTGTGLEIFVGYLKLFGAYAVFLGVPIALERLVPGSQAFAQAALGLGVVVLIPFAIYWSRTYLLSRTRWRGIRFGMQPGAGPYFRTFVVGFLLTIVTLGLYAPVWLNNCRRVLIERMRYGNEAFAFSGSNSDAFWITVKGVLLSIVTFGIYSFWFSAEMQRFTVNNIQFMGARGRSTITGGDMFAFFLVGMLATTFSFGLAFPWVLVWVVQTTLSRTVFEGEVDFRLIAQRAQQQGDATSDALAGELGVDLAV